MFTRLRTALRASRDRGASAVEYGLMVAAIAAVIVGIVFGLGTLVGNTFQGTCSAINAGQADAKAGNPQGTTKTGAPCK